MKKVVLELFSGNESFSKVMREKGFKCITLDNQEKFNPTICKDILEVTIEELPKNPFVIWASIPCQTFSIASVYVYWEKGKPKSERCKVGLQLLDHTIEIISKLKSTYWIIENPVGMMRTVINDYFRQYRITHYIRRTVTYCQYGFSIRKATDIWSNINNWFPKSCCRAGDSCHEKAPRGAKTGLQARNKNIPLSDRALVPRELCLEIRKVILGNSKHQQFTITDFLECET